MNPRLEDLPEPQAWVEIDLKQLRQNIRIIRQALPASVRLSCVIKNDAYGHGMISTAKIAAQEGVWGFVLSNVQEGVQLREAGIKNPLIILGERHPSEIPWCVAHDLTICLNSNSLLPALRAACKTARKKAIVHLKINTGMNRYGVLWSRAANLAEKISQEKNLRLEGLLTHFAQSDEEKKDFANLQATRFNEAARQIKARGVQTEIEHLCNSGGFLDLRHLHNGMVRVGILLYGVYPSLVCKKIEGIQSVMSVKARIASVRTIQPGDVVGYSMRYTAPSQRKIAVIPVGYGDGLPRTRNEGYMLIAGRKAPIIGGVAMNATMLDITGIPQAQMWSEVVIMGKQGDEEITARDLGKLRNTVTYDVLTGWNLNLPKRYTGE
jgi:alanine racemase